MFCTGKTLEIRDCWLELNALVVGVVYAGERRCNAVARAVGFDGWFSWSMNGMNDEQSSESPAPPPPPFTPPADVAAARGEADGATAATATAAVATNDRRTFLTKGGAVAAGAVAVLVPLGAGLATFFNPLRKRGGGGAADFIKVTTFEALKDDGLPHRFPVLADKHNVWMTEKNVAVGSVYLKRMGDRVVAWNTVCPHLGCQVDVVAGGSFKCPCHNSMFGKDGSLTPGSVSPRGMDELEVDPVALKTGEVRVRYQNFVASVAEKRPL